MSSSSVEWIKTTPRDAVALSSKAIIGGYEGDYDTPLWVIRAKCEGDLIPGKLDISNKAAYVAWGGSDRAVQNIEVCCAPPETVRWIQCRDGVIPPNAIEGGKTSSGELLYIGRVKEEGSLIPGKIQSGLNKRYILFNGREIAQKTYEVLCYD